MKSTLGRSKEWLRDHGWIEDTVERFEHHSRVKQDFFGVIDIIAVRGASTLGIQACSTKDFPAHRTKCLQEKRLREWLKGDRRFEIQAWSKVGRLIRGRTRDVWVPKRIIFLTGSTWNGIKVREVPEDWDE